MPGGRRQPFKVLLLSTLGSIGLVLVIVGIVIQYRVFNISAYGELLDMQGDNLKLSWYDYGCLEES